MRNRAQVRPDLVLTRYSRGLLIPNTSVTKLRQTRWLVLSSDRSRLYKVGRFFKRCLHAGCSREERDICSHKYRCTCPDTINPCKHIYKIHYISFQPVRVEKPTQNVRKELYASTEKLWHIISSARLSAQQAERLKRDLQQVLRPT